MKLACIHAWAYSENGPFKRLLRGCLERAGVGGWGYACQAGFYEPWDGIPEGIPKLLLGKETARILSGFDFIGKNCEIQNIRGTLLPVEKGWATLTIEPEMISVGYDRDTRGVSVGGKAQSQYYPLLIRDIKEAGADPYVPRISIVKPQQLHDLFAMDNPKRVSLDIEGADGKPNIVGLSWSRDQAYVMEWEPSLVKILQFILERAEGVFHNASYDIPELLTVGMKMPERWVDTINTSALLNPESKKNLQAQVLTYLPGAITWKGLINHAEGPGYVDKKVKTYRTLWETVLTRLKRRVPRTPTEWYCFYNGLDTAYTFGLEEEHRKNLKSEGRWSYYKDIMQPIQKPLIYMSLRGIRCDEKKLAVHRKGCERLKRMSDRILSSYGKDVLDKAVVGTKSIVLALEIERGDERIASGKRGKFSKSSQLTKARTKFNGALKNQREGFNAVSNKQRTALLYDVIGLPKKYKRGGKNPSADEKILEKLKSQLIRKTIKPKNDAFSRENAVHIIEAMLAATKWEHWRANYLSPPVVEGKVVTAYSQHRSVASRLSSGVDTSDPDKGMRSRVQQLQNVPKSLRDVFIPEDGCVFVGADWSNIQWGLTILSMCGVPKSYVTNKWCTNPDRDRWYIRNKRTVLEAYAGNYFQDLLEQFRKGEFDAHRYLASFAYDKAEKEISKEERQTCKPYTHGYNFDGLPGSLADAADHPRKVGVKVCEGHDEAFMTRPWKEWVTDVVFKRKYVETPAGWRRYFFGMKIKPTEVLGTLIQATEGDLMKWIMAQLAIEEPGVYTGEHKEGWLVITSTHDSLLVQSPKHSRERCAEWLKGWMERPVPWLDNRSWRADVKIGKDWREVG